jgi:5-methyltetrahydrofolate--homocysteine methyltransferase
VADVIHDLNTEVQKGEIEKVKELVKRAVAQGVAPTEVLKNGLRPAMEEIGRKFECLEIFLPEMMKAADAMAAGVEILQPHLASGKDEIRKGLIVLGTVEGDVHDIGKNIVGIMLEGAGFEVVDLGYDVPVLTFVERVVDLKPDIVGMSALMTSTMVHMPRVITALEERDLRDKVKVVVGGAPVLPEWAKEIGADGYGENAVEAVNLAKELVK